MLSALPWCASSQDFQWAFPAPDEVTDVATDGNGFVYICGRFFNTIDIDPGEGETFLTSAGSRDHFLCKYSADGALQWGHRFGGVQEERNCFIEVLSGGDVIFTFGYRGTIDVDPSETTIQLQGVFELELGITRFTPEGDLVWARKVSGATSAEYPFDLHIDQADNILIAGQFHGTVDFNPGGGISSMTAEYASDTFLLKLNAAGNFVWSRSWDWLIWGAMTTDEEGDIYAGGVYQATTDFDPGPGEFEISNAFQIEYSYFMKLTSDGAFVFAHSFGSPGNVIGDMLFLPPSSLFMTGQVWSDADYSPGAAVTPVEVETAYGNVFVLKCDTLGTLEWMTHTGDPDIQELGQSITHSPSGEIYVAGTLFNYPFITEEGLGFDFESEGGTDGFVWALSENGEHMWAGGFGGADDDTGVAISYDDHSLYIGGTFSDPATDLAPGSDTAFFDSVVIDGCLIKISAPECTHPLTETAVQICAGDSLFLGGAWQSQPGLYTDIFDIEFGCDSTVITSLSFFEFPDVTIQTEEASCSTGGSVQVSVEGDEDYSISWSDSSLDGLFLIENIAPSELEAVITHPNGCQVSNTIVISSPWSDCPADLDNDTLIGFGDMLLFIAAFGCTENCCPVDINLDGAVGISDLLILLSEYSNSCSP